LMGDPFRMATQSRRSRRFDADGVRIPNRHPVILSEAKP
jgi:hypothetical protein